MSYRRHLMNNGGSNNYLCFTAIEDGTFTFTYSTHAKADGAEYIEYSTDGKQWNRLLPGSANVATSITTPTILSGEIVYWRGKNRNITYQNGSYASIFSSTGKFNASGDVRSLFKPKLFKRYALNSYGGIGRLFQNSKIVNAENLLLPNFTATYAYQQLFENCVYLVNAPYFNNPLTVGCYDGMFKGCTSLETIPCTINTTSFVSTCCRNMFNGCTSFTTSPLIGGQYTVDSYALYGMFDGCTSLIDVEDFYIASITQTGASHMQAMFKNCTSLKRNPVREFPNVVQNNCFVETFYGCKFEDWGLVTLPAETLKNGCYNAMFRYSNIRYVKMLATDVSASSCLNVYLWSVPNDNSCVYVKNINATWATPQNGNQPNKWIVIYYDTALDKYYLDQNRSTECDDHGNVIN